MRPGSLAQLHASNKNPLCSSAVAFADRNSKLFSSGEKSGELNSW